MEMRPSDEEAACIKRLAQPFDIRRIDNGASNQNDPNLSLNLPKERWETVLRMMERYGAIHNVTHAAGIRFLHFRILPNAVELARQIREAEQESEAPRNIVEQIEKKAKSNPVFAWAIIVLGVLMALASLINNSLDILQKFGVKLK